MQVLGQTLFWTFLQGYFLLRLSVKLGFPSGAGGKESTCQCRRCKRLGFNPWVLGNDKPLQYSCMKNSMDREVWWTRVYGVTKKSDTTEHTHI